mmetsp:Transcript_7683/g.22672  ORF Transcript_7683/g.22672 Transcript_7683/m.22672 type:complete len:244 (-) Transcript_7683:1624-2355(-)
MPVCRGGRVPRPRPSASSRPGPASALEDKSPGRTRMPTGAGGSRWSTASGGGDRRGGAAVACLLRRGGGGRGGRGRRRVQRDAVACPVLYGGHSNGSGRGSRHHLQCPGLRPQPAQRAHLVSALRGGADKRRDSVDPELVAEEREGTQARCGHESLLEGGGKLHGCTWTQAQSHQAQALHVWVPVDEGCAHDGAGAVGLPLPRTPVSKRLARGLHRDEARAHAHGAHGRVGLQRPRQLRQRHA